MKDEQIHCFAGSWPRVWGKPGQKTARSWQVTRGPHSGALVPHQPCFSGPVVTELWGGRGLWACLGYLVWRCAPRPTGSPAGEWGGGSRQVPACKAHTAWHLEAPRNYYCRKHMETWPLTEHSPLWPSPDLLGSVPSLQPPDKDPSVR